ncbi:unnamed protein product, partial [Staurois parvus]
SPDRKTLGLLQKAFTSSDINSAGCPNFCRRHFFVFCYFESVNNGNKI